MTYETIEQTINLLCEKLGLAVNEASKVIPELVRMSIWTNAITVIMCTLAIVVLIGLCIKTDKLCVKDEVYDESHDVMRVASFVVAFVTVPILLCFGIEHLLDLVKWIVAPNIQAIEYISSLIG